MWLIRAASKAPRRSTRRYWPTWLPTCPAGGTGAGSGGPGGAGGGSAADFDSLIDLITQTVSPTTWDHNGGKGESIAASPTNLSLVVSQTQEVHEEIVDLLEQLRRMQDLQVTIEVRFYYAQRQFLRAAATGTQS